MGGSKDPKAKAKTLGSPKRTLTNVTLLGAEKRYKPNKHYVFILQPRWSDRTEFVIYRSYSQFYDFHVELLEFFPIEAGDINGSDRTIPYLPGRRIFHRNEVQKVASKRQEGLGEYCLTLINLPRKISQHAHVLTFFEATQEDINPPNDVTDKPKSSLLTALLPFFSNKSKKERHPDKGLAKSAEDLTISGPVTLEMYVVIADYKAQDKSEISLEAQEEVEVVEKHDNGWWFVQSDKKQGWAPASFLEPLDQISELDEPEPDFIGEWYITTEEYRAQYDDEISFLRGTVVEVMHKLLDGWWIVNLQDQPDLVGYVPAAYLQPYKNPHMKPVAQRSSSKKKLKPIPRRRTIKNASTKWGIRKQRDLTIYRKFSSKRKQPGQKPALPPPIQTHDTIQCNSKEVEDEIYENTEVVEKRYDAGQPQYLSMGDQEEEEEEEYEYIDEDTIKEAAYQHQHHLHEKEFSDIYENGEIHSNDNASDEELYDEVEYYNIPDTRALPPKHSTLPSKHSILPPKHITLPPKHSTLPLEQHLTPRVGHQSSGVPGLPRKGYSTDQQSRTSPSQVNGSNNDAGQSASKIAARFNKTQPSAPQKKWTQELTKPAQNGGQTSKTVASANSNFTKNLSPPSPPSPEDCKSPAQIVAAFNKAQPFKPKAKTRKAKEPTSPVHTPKSPSQIAATINANLTESIHQGKVVNKPNPREPASPTSEVQTPSQIAAKFNASAQRTAKDSNDNTLVKDKMKLFSQNSPKSPRFGPQSSPKPTLSPKPAPSKPHDTPPSSPKTGWKPKSSPSAPARASGTPVTPTPRTTTALAGAKLPADSALASRIKQFQ